MDYYAYKRNMALLVKCGHVPYWAYNENEANRFYISGLIVTHIW